MNLQIALRAAPFAAAALLLFAPRTARADDDAPLGKKGKIAFDDLLGLTFSGAPGGYGVVETTGIIGFGSTSTDRPSMLPGGTPMWLMPGNATYAWLDPSLDVFVSDRVTLGGALRLQYAFQRATSVVYNDDGSSSTSFESRGRSYGGAITPRVGYYAPISPGLGSWWRVGVGYGHQWTENEGAVSMQSDSASAQASVVLAAHLGAHAFFLVGPQAEYTWISMSSRAGAEVGTMSTFDASVHGSFGMSF